MKTDLRFPKCSFRIPLFALLLLTLNIPLAMAQTDYTIAMPIRGDDRMEPIELQNLKIETIIIGGLASTQLDMTFYNPNRQTLEGNFELPLPPGWKLAKFSLDIDGHLREAVPVPKSTGKQAFKAIVRKGVDPALVEHVQGNLFKTRIYPFSPRKTRRVVVTLDHPLEQLSGNEAFIFPYTFEKAISTVSLTVRVLERPADGAELKGLPASKQEKSRTETVYEYTAQRVTIKDKLELSFKSPYSPTPLQAVDKDGVIYAIPVSANSPQTKRPIAREITLLWDASESARNIDKTPIIKLLEGYLAEMKDGKIHLQPFHIRCESSKMFTVKNGTCAQLFQAIDDLAYDGATDLNCIPWNHLKGDAVILVTDGLHTDAHALNRVRKSPIIHIVTNSIIREEQWLKGIATRSNGSLIDLTRISGREALEMLTHTRMTVTSWGNGENTYKYPQFLENNRTTWLYGVSKKPIQTLDVEYSSNAKSLFKGDAIPGTIWRDAEVSSLLRRGFAHQEVARLRSLGLDDKAETIAAMNGIVTHKTSLIVLEEASDYAEYRIEPPQELRAQYDRIIAEREKKGKRHKKSNN